MTQQNTTFYGVGTWIWAYDLHIFKRPDWDIGNALCQFHTDQYSSDGEKEKTVTEQKHTVNLASYPYSVWMDNEV